MSRAAFVLAALVAGIAFGAATASGSVRGGGSTLHVVADNTDVDHSDPAISYSLLGWQIEYETCATLVGYSDRSGKVSNSVGPIGAAGMPVVSNGGKTYTFRIKRGMRFSNGDPITAANYEYAFDRDALHNLNSPVTAFMSEVKGWDNENNHAGIQSVSGVTASGSGAGTLTIRLSAPDGTLLPVLAMPFFCPLDKAAPFWDGSQWKDSEVKDAWPGSGPYYLSSRTVGSQIVLQKNPYYTGTQRSTADAIVIDMNVSTNNAYDGISNGTYAVDVNGNPEPAQNQALATEFGVNTSRLRVHPTSIVSYLALNTARPIFHSVGARKGLNYAIDRPGLIKIGGYLSASPTVQILPRQLAGGVWSTKLYPITTPGSKQFATARQLSDNCGVGHTQPLYFYHGSSSASLARVALIKTDLEQMGCTDIVDVFPDPRYHPAGYSVRYDIELAGWSEDYPDAYDYLGYLLDGRTLADTNNNDLSHFDNKAFNSKLDKANRLNGVARSTAFGELDQWVMKNFAPLAPISDVNFVDYLSPNAHGYVYNGPLDSVDLGYLSQS
jgi:peptide/nickel transport system substrate-binding protein